VGLGADRGGYSGVAINPMPLPATAIATTLGREVRCSDAKLLADLVRTDRHNHRLVRDSPDAEAIKCWPVPIRVLIWARSGMPNVCAVRCASTTPRRWRHSTRSPS